MMKKLLTLALLALVTATACVQESGKKQELPASVTLTESQLINKIKGAWAGQVIGCTYGGPTEFRFNGTMIQDYTKIP